LWPDGFAELLIHYGDRYRLENNENLLPHGFFIGPLTRCTRLYTLGRLRLFGIRFYPWGFSSLFNIPMTDLQDKVIPLQQLLGSEASILEDRLYDVNVHTAADILQQWLVQKVKDARIPEPKTLHLIRSMYAASGNVHIALLPELTGLSLRQIERKWREITGMSPKKMSVVLRFDAARRWLLYHPDADLMDVTHRFGYYDYAHFSRAFKNGIGMTPRQFQQRIMNLNIPGNNGDVVFVQDERDHMC